MTNGYKSHIPGMETNNVQKFENSEVAEEVVQRPFVRSNAFMTSAPISTDETQTAQIL